MLTRTRVALLGMSAALIVAISVAVMAAMLTRVSDTISISAPGEDSAHAIRFTVTQAIPPSGEIVITPHSGAFTIPSAFDHTDVDLATASGGVFTDRTLAATADSAADGVAVVAGALGSVTIKMNTTAGIPAGEVVVVELGTNATHGENGDQSLINPSAVGSYRIDLMTKNASGTTLDTARAMVAIVNPVQPSAIGENFPPTRANGLPSGEVAAGNDDIEISFTTDEVATCRYSTVPDTDYNSMTGTLVSAGGTVFYAAISGHENATSYTYYVRCIDLFGVVNLDDYAITFDLATTPISNTSIATSNTSGTGTGPIPGGSNVLFLSSVTLSGLTSPGSSVTILRDGTAAGSGIAGGDGAFSARLTGLERGVYTFLVYATDRSQRKSASLASTITLGQGTNNAIANLLIPPTLAATGGADGGASVTGASVPGSVVELFAQGSAGEKQYTATANGSGEWEVAIPASDVRGTIALRSRARIGDQLSELSEIVAFGGGSSTAEGDGSDLNGDSKVNLVDFSIMLSAWGTSAASADLNGDGTVNLADFSILLFGWTG